MIGLDDKARRDFFEGHVDLGWKKRVNRENPHFTGEPTIDP